jgi:2-polyprenyl-3-methyl-5-hydroxy-6-metoxy-1,4-benzoquinol methylase
MNVAPDRVRRILMPNAALFELDDIFDDDYLYFYEQVLTRERTSSELNTIWRLLSLQPGENVLDLGCGYGRIANGLAQQGVNVTGLDRSAHFLDLARADATAMGVNVDYVAGDMRQLRWVEHFDAVIIWFTTFGYFRDEENESVLEQALRSLRPGGRLLIEQINRYGVVRHGSSAHHVTRRGNDVLLDINNYDGLTDRMETERLIIRNGGARATRYTVRLYGFMELSRILSALSASRVGAFGRSGEPFTLVGPRLIVLAVK